MELIAEQLYDAYGASTNYLNFMGNPMPKWEDLPLGVREAWAAAATRAKEIFATVS